MNVMESYRSFLTQRASFKELSELRDKCFRIYENSCTLKDMQKIIENDWRVLLNKLPIHLSYSDITIGYDNLTKGYINRREFASETAYVCDNINSLISEIQKEAETYAAEFSNAYNSFFTKGAKNAENCGTKLIYQALMQPEAKEIIMEFLKL